MELLNYFFIDEDLKNQNNLIKATILHNFPNNDFELIKKNLKQNYNFLSKIYKDYKEKNSSFFLKLRSWPGFLPNFDDYMKMNFILNITNAALQYKFWITPGVNSKFNSLYMQELIQNASDLVITSNHFLSFKKYEKLLLKQIKIELLKNNVPFLKERFETIEYLEKYGVHLKNPVFLNDFFRKKQFFAIYLIANFINYLLTTDDYKNNTTLKELILIINNYLFPVIDYRIPQAFYNLKIFKKIQILEKIKKRILNYDIFIENEKDEFILRGYSFITMYMLLSLFHDNKSILITFSDIDSVLFRYAKTCNNIPHHYCHTMNY